MLNWRLEEKQYVEERLKEYRKELNGLALIFMSKKQLNKNIDYITEQAKLNYRAAKLDDYLDEIEEERKRIDKLVNDLNGKFDNYMSNQQHIISKNIRPFQMEAKPYDGLSEPTLSQLEVVTIHCEPFKLAFIQEKVGE